MFYKFLLMALPYIIMLSLTQIFALASLFPTFMGRVRAEQKNGTEVLTKKEKQLLAIPVEKLANMAIARYLVVLVCMTVVAAFYFSQQDWANPWLLTGMFFVIGFLAEVPNMTYKKKRYIQQVTEALGKFKLN